MPDENFESTKIDSTKGLSGETEVDALIAGALAELDVKPKEEKKELKATPIKPAHISAIKTVPAPQPEAKIEKKEEVKPTDEAKKADDMAYEETFKKFSVGALVKGKVVRIDASGALIDIAYKSDGFLSNEELSQSVKIGDEIDVVIEKLESKEGYVVLSKKKADFEKNWIKAYDANKKRTLLSVKVTSAVSGGLVVDWEGIRSFIPASQVEKKPEQLLKDFVGQTIPAKIIEANRRQSKIVMSHKFGIRDHERSQASKFFEEIEVGQVHHGRVTSIKNFGAFVNINGIEGLIPLTELSWKRVKHPSELLKTGQELDVFVLGIDKINRKISFGLKELQPDPWADALTKYKPGQIIKVKIARLVKFGAFAELDDTLEGLIHISELSANRINSPEEVVKPGDEVEVKILRIVPDEQKIGLSIKDAVYEKEKKASPKAAEEKSEEKKVTIGDLMAEKERQKAERETEFEVTEEEVIEEQGQDQGLT
ncbi:MAG: small subunit ribosomal protein S1 [Candidatus Saganbacteria bacterium]|uniref:Small subunit ribosomal protein S1 n=1 Tax=Candidatus Saganbacteria bacterium TaxID=2575572 RepID=A0A833L060_UNCSA|nr:MAG: small subunit ribosomal protein S1 [Candidatus Saganbacteria bacterium]